jgi:hypothetical protein
MAELLKDVKANISSQAHKDLSALAHAKGCHIGELLRAAVDFYLADEMRKAHEYKVFLRMQSVQGNDTESRGTVST